MVGGELVLWESWPWGVKSKLKKMLRLKDFLKGIWDACFSTSDKKPDEEEVKDRRKVDKWPSEIEDPQSLSLNKWYNAKRKKKWQRTGSVAYGCQCRDYNGIQFFPFSLIILLVDHRF